MRPGSTSAEYSEIPRLKCENAELRRAKEILKAASTSSRPDSTGHIHAREVINEHTNHRVGPDSLRWGLS
jgi:transposase-like protein